MPLLYVRGNHDRGVNWQATSETLPEPVAGCEISCAGVGLVGLVVAGR